MNVKNTGKTGSSWALIWANVGYLKHDANLTILNLCLSINQLWSLNGTENEVMQIAFNVKFCLHFVMKLLTKVLISPYMKGKSLNWMHFTKNSGLSWPGPFGATNIIFILHLLTILQQCFNNCSNAILYLPGIVRWPARDTGTLLTRSQPLVTRDRGCVTCDIVSHRSRCLMQWSCSAAPRLMETIIC